MLFNIKIADFLKIQNDVNIIDIRIIENFNRSHIPNAKNIPMDNLLANPHKYLDFHKTYYIYCQRGLVSPRVCNTLRNKGFNVVNILGGYEEYILNK